MPRHQITLKELVKWKAEKEIRYASCSKDQKALHLTLNGKYRIYSQGELVFECEKAFEAVRSYNNL